VAIETPADIPVSFGRHDLTRPARLQWPSLPLQAGLGFHSLPCCAFEESIRQGGV